MEPKVTDRVDAVSEAGASEIMREVNIRKRSALYILPSFILSIFKFYLGLTNCSLITSFDLIMNVEF